MVIEYRSGNGESLENAQSIASRPEGRRGELKEEIFWSGIQLIWQERKRQETGVRVYQIDAEEQFSSVGIYWVH